MTIKQTTKHYVNASIYGSPAKWTLKEEETAEITKQEYDMIVDNRFKGDRYYKGYTCLGYTPIKIVSRFDDLKTVREFEIK